jgi:fermentation-respiration switch protein FrsA (DUF1100 family)
MHPHPVKQPNLTRKFPLTDLMAALPDRLVDPGRLRVLAVRHTGLPERRPLRKRLALKDRQQLIEEYLDGALQKEVVARYVMISREFGEFYSSPRGYHPNSITQFTATSSLSFMNFPQLDKIEWISPRPILFVTGEHAHSRYFSEDAYEAAVEPKELYAVPGAGHEVYNGPRTRTS